MSVFPLTKTPTIFPNLITWIDGNDPNGTGIQPADSSAIATWVDKSGRKNSPAQATGASQPLFKVNIINQKGCILFDGVDDSMQSTLASNISTTVASCFSVILESSFVLNTTPASLVGSGSGNDAGGADSGIPFILNASTNQRGFRNSVALSSRARPAAGTPFLTSSIFDGANHTIYINGVAATPVASVGSFNVNRIQVGSRWVSSAPGVFYNGYIAELIIYQSDMTTNRTIIERYLANKWGISI